MSMFDLIFLYLSNESNLTFTARRWWSYNSCCKTRTFYLHEPLNRILHVAVPLFFLDSKFCFFFSFWEQRTQTFQVYIFFSLLMCTRTESSSFRYKRFFFSFDLINHFKSVKRRTDIIQTREYMYQFWIISFAFKVIFLSIFFHASPFWVRSAQM